jgi:hypothetical protein
MKVHSKFHEILQLIKKNKQRAHMHRHTQKNRCAHTYAQYNDLISLLFFLEEGKQGKNWNTVPDLFIHLRKAYG